MHILKGYPGVSEPGDTLLQQFPGSEHRGMILHDPLHLEPDPGRRPRSSRMTQSIEAAQYRLAQAFGQGFVGLAGFDMLGTVVCRGPAKDDEIQERIGSQAISAMHRDTG